MKITEILELEKFALVEPSFSDLPYQEMDDLLSANTGNGGLILIDENENPVIFGKNDNNEVWMGCCTLFREPSLALIDSFEQFEFELFQEKNETIQDAVREYYSTALRENVEPGADDLNPARITSIDALLRDLIKNDSGNTCLDCCCGTGVGSMILEQYGMHPLAYDNDESLLARGMKAGRLKPERTMWIDGRMIHHYLTGPVHLACGFMVGEIHAFNAPIWEEIIGAACNVSDTVLFTAGTELEIKQVRDWVVTTGKKVEIFETESDPIYDRWVCYSE